VIVPQVHVSHKSPPYHLFQSGAVHAPEITLMLTPTLTLP
jgi:hypothetical protein